MTSLSNSTTTYLRHAFIQIGLTDEHAEIYIANLTLGTSLPAQIAKKADIPRSTAYDLLHELEEWHFVRKISDKKKYHYSAENPIRIKEQLEYKKNRINDISYTIERNLYELESVYNKNESYNSPIRLYNGDKDLRTALQECLVADKISVYLSLGSPENTDAEMIDIIDDLYSEIDLHNLEVRSLVEGSEITTELMDEYKHNPNLDIIFIPGDQIETTKSPFSKILFDDTYMNFDLLNKTCILHTDTNFYRYEKVAYDSLWEHMKSKYGLL